MRDISFMIIRVLLSALVCSVNASWPEFLFASTSGGVMYVETHERRAIYFGPPVLGARQDESEDIKERKYHPVIEDNTTTTLFEQELPKQRLQEKAVKADAPDTKGKFEPDSKTNNNTTKKVNASKGEAAVGLEAQGKLSTQHMLEAERLYSTGRYAEAEKNMLFMARQGNTDAAFGLGLLYARGDLAQPDFAAAEHWWLIAAEKEHPEALYNLGLLYYRGVLGNQELKKSSELWVKASSLGHGDAMYMLGRMYQGGEGVSKDVKAAVKWYEQAARLGHPDAQYQLGRIYLSGAAGIIADQEKALYWMEKAAISGHPGAAPALKLFK